MEGSVAAAGSAGTNNAGGDAGADAGDGQTPSVDAALTSRLDGMESQQREMFEFLQTQPWTPQDAGDGGDGEPEAPAMDLSMFEDPDADPEALANGLQQIITQAAEAQTKQAIAPLQQVIDGMQKDSQWQAVIGEFPEMGDPAVRGEVVNASKAIAEQMGAPQMAENPLFARVIYMAGRVAGEVAKEGGEQPSVATLEGGGGAGPAGGGQGNPVDAIMGAKKGASVLGSW